MSAFPVNWFITDMDIFFHASALEKFGSYHNTQRQSIKFTQSKQISLCFDWKIRFQPKSYLDTLKSLCMPSGNVFLKKSNSFLHMPNYQLLVKTHSVSKAVRYVVNARGRGGGGVMY